MALMWVAGGAMAEKTGVVQVDPGLMARIQKDTERYRKGGACIRVLDARGRPVEGASVKAEQVTHDFLFGCNIYMFDRFPTAELSARYKEMFRRLFNYATLPFYWRGFEPQPGKKGYDYIDKVARWCREYGVTPKGHPLVWACHEAGVPAWLPQDKPDEVKRLMEARVREIVGRYKGLIGVWDVVNESTHGERFAEMSVFDLTSRPVTWAREANPEAMLIVNEFGVIGDHEGKGPFFKLLKEMNETRVPYDTIGIQTHMHGGLFPIPSILATLDKYAELWKPIHFTETTVISGKETNPADEEKQARQVEIFYRACFSHPSVKAITWWDFSDAGAWQGVAAGLVRKDLSPKPVYRVLDRLINKEWRTKAEGRTNSDGVYAFRGFYGKYRISVTTLSGTKIIDFDLTRDPEKTVMKLQYTEDNA
jgi:GH35 family endo-1,4-beta-xylanase